MPSSSFLTRLQLGVAFGIGTVAGSASVVLFNSSTGVAPKEDQLAVSESGKQTPVLAPNTSRSRMLPITRKEPKWSSFTPSSVHQGCIKPWNFNWDYRHFDILEDGEGTSSMKKRPTATRHLILVRHGQYNLEGNRDEERSLTSVGEIQAMATGKRLKELGLPLTYLVSSTMTRAKQTADLITLSLPRDIPVRSHDPVLCEGAPYPPEPGSVKGEDVYHVDGARIESSFRKYFHRAEREQQEDSYEVLVCHANVIRYFVCRALQLPPEAWLRMSLKHGSMTWVTIRPDGRTSVRALGETGHLSPHLLTTT